MQQIPKQIQFSALSQHLYVDRRGAPENFQGNYSTLEKCALSKAIAQQTNQCDSKLIISEVNWPLINTGEYSPIACLISHTWDSRPLEISPQSYAAYMVRYLLITLCSGLAEEVYWWRLSAHGYGLIDDLNHFTQRPAYFALKKLLESMRNTTFLKKLPSAPNHYLLYFEQNQQNFIIGWTTHNSATVNCEFKLQSCEDLYENPVLLNTNHQHLHLTPQPKYFYIYSAKYKTS